MIVTIATEADVEALFASRVPAWLLKHSNSCSISQAAFEAFQEYLVGAPADPAGVVVVQHHRPLCGWIGQRLGYGHQSPQLFLLRAGSVLWQASHWSITVAAMTAARRAAAPADAT